MFNALFIAQSIAYCATTACLQQVCDAALLDEQSPMSIHSAMLELEAAHAEARAIAHVHSDYAQRVWADNYYPRADGSGPRVTERYGCPCTSCAAQFNDDQDDESTWFGGYATAGDQADNEAIEACEQWYDERLLEEQEAGQLFVELRQHEEAERGFYAGLHCELCGDERSDQSASGLCDTCENTVSRESAYDYDQEYDNEGEQFQERLEAQWHEQEMAVLRNEHAEEYEAEHFGEEFTEQELVNACGSLERARIKALLQGFEQDIQAQSVADAAQAADDEQFRLGFIARFRANNPQG